MRAGDCTDIAQELLLAPCRTAVITSSCDAEAVPARGVAGAERGRVEEERFLAFKRFRAAVGVLKELIA